ncbi:MAG TPA: hypothetical protein DDY52_02620 [Candidatus Moranbacteria bacterium]|nr:MAG: hypothetical protein UR51_C0019G0027 [Candidatus Moranbacteria bacterium GW2011_GWF1_34_10]HBI17022.1 hypothetical protein [Candidatus Moranbacteria bacterium]
METILLFFLGFYQCDPATMKNGFDQECTEIIEKHTPRPAGFPSKWGFVPTGGISCPNGGQLVGNQCEERYLGIKR